MGLTKLRSAACSALVGLASLIGATPSYAIDVNSQDWLPAPAGTNFFLNYTIYGTRSEYISNSGAKIDDNTSLDSFVNILRYVHFVDVGGMLGVVQAVLPMGGLYNAELGGVELNNSAGVGDPVVAAALWPINNKKTETYVAIEPFLFIPLGQYDKSDAVNFGENRWKLDLQVGWYQGLGNGFATQLTLDAIWYGDNDQAGGGYQTLSQDNTYQFQGWLSYGFSPTFRGAIGYAKLWGGTEFLDGVETGNATERDQIRLELSKFLTPTFQVLGDVSRDIETEGGFKEDFRGTLRLLQVF